MREANIDEIIAKIYSRVDSGASKQFIEIFSGVVKYYLAYKRWVEMMIAKNGSYQGEGPETMSTRYIDYLSLIDSIELNGMSTPIKEIPDPLGYEIDGYHRLVIMRALGHKTIQMES